MATPLQPRNGLLDMMGQGESGFAGWLNPRRNAIINFGTGMIGHGTAKERMAGAAQGLQTGRQQDTAQALLMEERAQQQQQLQQQTEQRNATLEFLQRSHPDLAQAVAGGLPIADAWKESFNRREGAGGSSLTADQRNFALAQQDPEFAEFLGVGQQNLPADVQEYNWYAEQERAAGREPLSFLDFGNAQRGQGLSVVTNPDGTTSVQMGGSSRALTEGQSKDAVFATRAAGALPVLDQFGAELTNPIARAVESDPTGIARGALQGENFQRAQQAGLEFLQAILRKDTGAAITPQEQTEYGRVYLPMPGDTPAVLAQKQQSRARALAALKAGMPPQAILNMETALQQGNTGSGVVDYTTYFQ